MGMLAFNALENQWEGSSLIEMVRNAGDVQNERRCALSLHLRDVS